MGNNKLTIPASASGLYKEKGSKFLAFAHQVHNTDEIKEIVAYYKKEHHKARHVCYAYRLENGTVYRAADDGEPAGTAGRPILRQLEAAELCNILIVVVRYFGGTLLGTGGLANAYKTAAHDAIEHLNTKG